MTDGVVTLASPTATLRWHHVDGFVPAPDVSDGERRTWDEAHAGAPIEAKLSVRSVDVGTAVTTVHTTTTDWREVSLAHASLERDPTLAERASAELVAGRTTWPNLLGVHAVVRSADGQLLASRRDRRVRYHPGAWSVSFEEGFAVEEVHRPDPVWACAVRGLHEELGLSVDVVARVRPLGLVLEVGLANPAVLAEVELDVTAEEAMGRVASAVDEVSDVRFVRSLAELGPLHPTSAVRWALAGA